MDSAGNRTGKETFTSVLGHGQCCFASFTFPKNIETYPPVCAVSIVNPLLAWSSFYNDLFYMYVMYKFH